MSEISAQLEPVNLRPTVEGFYRLFSSDQDIKNMDNDELEKALKREERKAFLLHLFVVYHDADRENRSSIAMTQKQIKANPQAKNVENLFYCAWLAVDNTLESEIIRPAADADSVRTKELYTDLASFDYHFSIYQAGMERAIFLHELTLNPQLLKNPQYHTIASMHMQVNLLTQACGILMKYGPEIAAVQTENGFEYENRDFLHYLIRTARTQALQNIQECQKLNIPCLAAIGYFENAEIARDDNTADKIHDVLEYYWEAGLTAKALVMSFK